MSGPADPLAALIDHLRAHSLRTDGPFTLRSGKQSDWYLDARQTTFSGAGARLVGQAVLDVLEDGVDAVGGMTMGADPMAIATATAGGLRAFSVRKAAKEHGTGGRLVGPVGSGDRVAVLDDTVTTGGALLEAIDVVTAAGLVVAQAVVLVDRSDGVVAAAMAERTIRFAALVEPSDLGVVAPAGAAT